MTAKGISGAIRGVAAADPGAVALLDDRGSVSYGELVRLVDAAGQRLASSGCRRGSVVALDLPRTRDWVVALLAILDTGASYLPLRPQDPASRRDAVLSSAGARVLLTVDGVRSLDGRAEQPGPGYILATSGSTGVPKLVDVPEAGLLNHAAGFTSLVGLTSRDVVLQMASPAFDTHAEELFPALMAGAAVALLPEEARASPEEVLGHCARAGITLLDLPTSLLPAIVRVLKDGRASLPASVRAVVVGGERLHRSVLDAWFEVSPGVAIFNTYGPTEASIIVTGTRLAEGERGEVSIGRPLPGCSVHILDEELRELPPGEIGMLWIGGRGLARGYVGDPAATAAGFVAHPLAGEGGRLYRTGDLACRRPDGDLEFVGRADGQVKVRGHRVEPGEIESVLVSHHAVDDAAVVAEPTPDGVRLIAYVAAASGPPAADELDDLLGRALPDYMQPAQLRWLPAIPRTATDKLDRAALAGLDAPPLSRRRRGGDAGTDTESRLLAIWRELLEDDAVGVDDDFFAAGGHSLLAVQVIARIQAELGRRVRLRDLFANPTVTAFAPVVDSADAHA